MLVAVSHYEWYETYQVVPGHLHRDDPTGPAPNVGQVIGNVYDGLFCFLDDTVGLVISGSGDGRFLIKRGWDNVLQRGHSEAAVNKGR